VGERSGVSTGSLRAGLKFYGDCLRDAWRGSWDMANAWAPTAGLLVLWGGARLAGYDIPLPVEPDRSALVIAVLFIVAAWIAVFLVQLIAAPPKIAASIAARATAAAPVAVRALPRVDAPASPAPALTLRLHDQIEEVRAVDTAGDVLPTARAYLARVTNGGDHLVRRCQIFFVAPTHIQVVSGPFDLAPGAQRDLPVLRIIDRSDEPHALAYFLDSETWHVAQGQAAWLPEPGRFKLKVLSANASPAVLEVDLSCTVAKPEAWTLVEAAVPDSAPLPETTGRDRAAWAGAAIPAPEASLGD
jgi:hypothetical protein